MKEEELNKIKEAMKLAETYCDEQDEYKIDSYSIALFKERLLKELKWKKKEG